MPFDEVFLKSSEAMDELAEASVALTVTSPPYWNAIEYDTHAGDSAAWYRERRETDYQDYLALMARVFGETLRVTRPGGFAAVVAGTILNKGEHTPLPFHLTMLMERIGWSFHQDIIWHKVTGGVKRAGSFIQRPYPGYFYPNIMTEYILIFRKPGEPIYRDRSEEIRSAAATPIDGLFTTEIANNVWHIPPVPPGYLDHPCPFPEEIPARLIALYSYPGDLVLDPFMGVGTTPKVAHHMGRRYAGYDILDKYVEASRARICEPIHLRAKQIVAKWDKIALNGWETLAQPATDCDPAPQAPLIEDERTRRRRQPRRG